MLQNVYTLLCEKDMGMGLLTLPRIIKFLESNQKLEVFGDGSLSQKSIEILRSLSTNVSVITKEERNEEVNDMLAKYPVCRSFREELPLAYKLLDIPLLAQKNHTNLTFTDSDIIYIKNCEAYFNQDVNVHLRTDNIKISVRLQKLFLKYKWKMPFKINSGYFNYNLENYDLDFLEYYLALPDVRNTHWLIEQTAWGLLLAEAGNSLCPDEKQFACDESFSGPNEETLAIHLIGDLKSKVEEWTKYAEHNDQGAQLPIFEHSRNVTYFDWFSKSLKRVF